MVNCASQLANYARRKAWRDAANAPTNRRRVEALELRAELRVGANALVDHHIAVLVGGAEERFAAIRPHGDG